MLTKKNSKLKEEKETEDSNKNKIIEELGENVVFRGDNKKVMMSNEMIETGILSIDKILGGGIPKGRLTEIYGSEGCGKTTFTLQLISNQSKKDSNFSVLFIDSEHALNIKYASSLGIKMSNFWITQPASAEEALEIISKVSKNKLVDLIILDSVAALTPKSEIEGDIGDTQVASLARTMSNSLKRIIPEISENKIAMIFINQLRSNVNTFSFGSSESTTGGKALRYFTSMRIELTRSTLIKNKSNTAIGHMLKIRTTKNKVSLPYQDALFEFYFGQGISRINDIVQIAINKKIISKSGSYYYLKEKSYQGKENFLKHLEENLNVLKELEEKITETKY